MKSITEKIKERINYTYNWTKVVKAKEEMQQLNNESALLEVKAYYLH